MNKRQKAKHFKMLYESLLAKGGPPCKVIHTSIPVETYRVVKVMDDDLPPDIRTFKLRLEMVREFEKILEKNLIIEEVPPENNYQLPRKMYATTVRIAWQ